MNRPTIPQLIDAVRHHALFDRDALQAQELRNIAAALTERFNELQQQIEDLKNA